MLDERQEVIQQLSFAELVDRFAAGAGRRDAKFARNLAQTLHEHRARVRLPQIDLLGMTDVVATIALDRQARLVITGWLYDGIGEVTLRFEERDFPAVDVQLHREPEGDPMTWCTLDFSCRGRTAVISDAAAGLPADSEVTLVALSTVGDVVQYRARAGGRQVSLPAYLIQTSTSPIGQL